MSDYQGPVLAVYTDDKRCLQEAESLANHLGCSLLTSTVTNQGDADSVSHQGAGDPVRHQSSALILHLTSKGLSLESDGLSMPGDYTRMLPRVRPGKWEHEILIKAVRFKDESGPLRVMDCTAGLGEDSLIMAAAGFEVSLYESDPVIAALCKYAIRSGRKIPELRDIVPRMELHEGDSVAALRDIAANDAIDPPDVIYLDPMFPGREKSALIKKKFQLLHQLEAPCANEEELMQAAIDARPRKIVVKRPPKGPYLAGVKPNYSIGGKAIRFDCITL